MSQEFSQGGRGFDDLRLICNEEYLVSTVDPLPKMLDSKSKRRNRRSENVQMLEQSYSKGMDVIPFYSKNDHQEDLWSCLNKNTVTIAIGPSGVGKTLVALWWGLTEISKGNIDKIYYVRSDVGCSYQRGR